MSQAMIQSERSGFTGILRSPLALLALVAAVLPFFLMVRMNVPIGPMYWDLLVYFDAANRIFDGQVPVVDFFIPVGPLGYYLFAGGLKLFPDAQPLLLVSWSMLIITGPLMAVVLWAVEPRYGRGVAFALLLPFLVFALLPFNVWAYVPYPGSDGYGIYNRQVCQLLYVLVAALIFMRQQFLIAVVVTCVMAALFLTKITGFVAGLLICLFAFCAGRIAFRYALGSALVFFSLLGVLELWQGIVSHYLQDMLTLATMNSGKLLPRFLRGGSDYFGILAPAALLVLVLIWSTRAQIRARLQNLRRSPSWENLTELFNHDALWLGVILFAGLFFETQNTGSQAFIFLWPVALWIVASWLPQALKAPRTFATIAVLAGIAVFVPLDGVIQRATVTYVSALRNTPLLNENLKTIGSVNARPEMHDFAADVLRIYANRRETYQDFVNAEQLPSLEYYGHYGFQLAHLMAFDRAVSDIRALEAEKDSHFDTIMALNFVNPFPYLMDRDAPKHIAIGADPTRAVPDPGSEEEKAVRNTDLVLYPTCPLTPDNHALYQLYEPALAEHRKISLGACFDAYVHPRFADAFG